MLHNVWLLSTYFPVGSKVEILDMGILDNNQRKMIGKIGTVTNVDIYNEWIGVHVSGPIWIASEFWNEFYDFQLRPI